MSALVCENVTRSFGTFIAVNGVSLRVRPGEVFGIIGPNGAGKTTLLNCAYGLDRQTSGHISVLGLDPMTDRYELTLRVGVQLQTAAVPPRLTVREVMRMFAALYADPLPWPTLLETLGIADKATTRVDTLSGGQRQRVFIALALLHKPEIVFLDELTTALDPQARLAMWDVVESIRSQGTTVVLTTHDMEEAERLCDRVGIIDRGRLIALDTVAGLIRAHAGDATATVLLDESPEDLPPLAEIDSVAAIHIDGRHLVIHGRGGFIQDVLARLTKEGIRVLDLKATSPGLEDVFLNLTGRSMRQGVGS